MEAVEQDGYALQFASAELKGDREIVIAAVAQDSIALNFTSSPSLKNGGLKSYLEGVMSTTFNVSKHTFIATILFAAKATPPPDEENGGEDKASSSSSRSSSSGSSSSGGSGGGGFVSPATPLRQQQVPDVAPSAEPRSAWPAGHGRQAADLGLCRRAKRAWREWATVAAT